MGMWIIYKQFVPSADIWVRKINADDTVWSYATEEEAVAAVPTVQPLYEGRGLRVMHVEELQIP